jgi:hypothetical protein
MPRRRIPDTCADQLREDLQRRAAQEETDREYAAAMRNYAARPEYDEYAEEDAMVLNIRCSFPWRCSECGFLVPQNVTHRCDTNMLTSTTWETWTSPEPELEPDERPRRET